jgi:ATP synthase protein I
VKVSEGLVQSGPINRLLKLQLTTLIATVLVVFLLQGKLAGIAYLYGGSIALISTLLQIWHLFAAGKYAGADAGKNLGRAYRCVAERWALTIVMFAIGFSMLTPALMIMVGFIVVQVVVLFGNLKRA